MHVHIQNGKLVELEERTHSPFEASNRIGQVNSSFFIVLDLLQRKGPFFFELRFEAVKLHQSSGSEVGVEVALEVVLGDEVIEVRYKRGHFLHKGGLESEEVIQDAARGDFIGLLGIDEYDVIVFSERVFPEKLCEIGDVCLVDRVFFPSKKSFEILGDHRDFEFFLEKWLEEKNN